MSESPVTEPMATLTVSTKTVYVALRNLLVNEHKLDRDGIMAAIRSIADDAIAKHVQNWMNGAHMRDYVGRMVRDTVDRYAGPLVRDEIKAWISKNASMSVTIGRIDPAPTEVPR